MKAADPETDASAIGPDNQALATYTTNLALECADFAYRFAGSQSLYVPNIIEKVMRDIHAASRHVAVQEVHYADLARRLVTEARRWTKA
jgi:alkylation response protein AidB-like acyl-CoA dehydrogenase